ncbi:hypothetical protein EMMF5_004372 [Cystobasidiomycetes sp. EMM_F5]
MDHSSASAEHVHYNHAGRPHGASAPPSLDGNAQESASGFQAGTVKTSNNDMVYLLTGDGQSNATVPSSWVTVPWSQILKELQGNEHLCLALGRAVSTQQGIRNKLLRVLSDGSNTSSSANSSLDFSDFSLASALDNSTAPGSELFAGGNQSDNIWDSPLATNTQHEQVQNTPLTSSADESPMSAAKPSFWATTASVQPMNLNVANLANLPAMPTPAGSVLSPTAIPMLGSSFAKEIIASSDTIDQMILREREYNQERKEYIWSQLDLMLYEIDDPLAQNAIREEGSIKMTFPIGTMLLCKEKDGAIASPAYTAGNPHSNEWLKCQVCHHKCSYRADTSSLKRPKVNLRSCVIASVEAYRSFKQTIREHFQKCLWLGDNHPLKVLSALQLRVLERESQGLLPNRRRARGIRPGHHPSVGGIQPSASPAVKYSPYPAARPPPVYSGNVGVQIAPVARSITPASMMGSSMMGRPEGHPFFGMAPLPSMPSMLAPMQMEPAQYTGNPYSVPITRNTVSHLHMQNMPNTNGRHYNNAGDSPLTNSISGGESPEARMR